MATGDCSQWFDPSDCGMRRVFDEVSRYLSLFPELEMAYSLGLFSVIGGYWPLRVLTLPALPAWHLFVIVKALPVHLIAYADVSSRQNSL